MSTDPATKGIGRAAGSRKPARFAAVDGWAPAIVADDMPACITEGRYHAVGSRSHLRRMFRTGKLWVEFTVLVPNGSERPDRVRLFRYYNVRIGADGRSHGRHSGDYFREWTLVANRRPSRGDRMSAAVFKGALVEVEVCTVTHDRQQRELNRHAQYSKIARVIGLLAGGGPSR